METNTNFAWDCYR